MAFAQCRFNLLRLRLSRRRFHSDIEVMEALWEEFRAAMMTETHVIRHESTPLFDGSSVRLRYWILTLRFWRRGEAEHVRGLLQHGDFVHLLVAEFDRRLQETTTATSASDGEGQSGRSPGEEGTSGEISRGMPGLAPRIGEAVVSDLDRLSQRVIQGDDDYLLSVKATLQPWRWMGAALSPRARHIIIEHFVALGDDWLVMGSEQDES